MLTTAEIASGLGPLLRSTVNAAERRSFARVVTDSRRAAPGDLFVALQGAQVDGHDFIPDAVGRGACGVIARHAPEATGAVVFLVENPLVALQRLAAIRRSNLAPRTIGITGSVGKTSTKETVAGLLAVYFPVLKSKGNLNTEIGLPLVLLGLTPEHRYLVVEMGMNDVGEIADLSRIARPDVGVVTNIGPVHLERLGSMERIVEAKSELVESLPGDGLAVLNADDARVVSMAARTRARAITFGLSPHAECRATDIEVHGLHGVSFRLHWPPEGGPNEPVSIHSPLLGKHSVYASLAAAAIGFHEGLSISQIREALAALRAESRIRVRTAGCGATVLDDCYNASPASVKAALDLLGDLSRPRIAVLGDMLELGAEEGQGHVEVGLHTAQRADRLIAIGPRMALAAEAARRAGLADVVHLEDKEAAAGHLDSLPQEANVLVKGSRGMALETVVEWLCALPERMGP